MRTIGTIVRGGLALLALVCVAAASHAQDIRARQNIEYRLIAPQPVRTGDRIEVIDFFWYGCPHCNDLQPALEGWVKRKPADVALRRIPAILRDSWAPHARIYYTLEQLGELERLHQKVYFSYHVEELQMSRPDVMERWAAGNGIDRERWRKAYFSPEVDARIENAKRLTEVYSVPGTPSLVVDGRYLTSSSMISSYPEMVQVLEDLIRLSRQRRAGG
ncbi:MAG: thiol:disulfide interchange protein DsbA/DsbL [Burkholderiales bacterium]